MSNSIDDIQVFVYRYSTFSNFYQKYLNQNSILWSFY